MDRVWQLSENVRAGVRSVEVHCVYGRGDERRLILLTVAVRNVYLCVCVCAAEVDGRPGGGDADEPETAWGAVLPGRVLYPHPARRLGGHRGAVAEAVRERGPDQRVPGSPRLHQ